MLALLSRESPNTVLKQLHAAQPLICNGMHCGHGNHAPRVQRSKSQRPKFVAARIPIEPQKGFPGDRPPSEACFLHASPRSKPLSTQTPGPSPLMNASRRLWHLQVQVWHGQMRLIKARNLDGSTCARYHRKPERATASPAHTHESLKHA